MQTSTSRLVHIPLQTLYNLLQPITLPKTSPRAKFTNWGQTYTCSPLAVFEPENDYQCELVLELARREGKTVRAVGVGHSPSDLACTSGYMLRTAKLDRVLEVSRIILSYLSLFIFLRDTSRPATNLHYRSLRSKAHVTLIPFFIFEDQHRQEICCRSIGHYPPCPPRRTRETQSCNDQRWVHLRSNSSWHSHHSDARLWH